MGEMNDCARRDIKTAADLLRTRADRLCVHLKDEHRYLQSVPGRWEVEIRNDLREIAACMATLEDMIATYDWHSTSTE